jgi:hypothetical protein
MLKMRLICALALLAGMLLGGIGAANAEGSEAARQACTPDAMRLCSEFMPDQAKVKSCMLSKRSQLSEACQLAMGAKPAKRERAERGEPHHHTYHHRRYRNDCDDSDDDCDN